MRLLAWRASPSSTGTPHRRSVSSVEVDTIPAAVHVRDSKVIDGPAFHVASAAWTEFVTYASGRDHRGE
ncbi:MULTISPECIES: DUF397 domain-containing protein [unclassified Streptomyces]|uniref:DUF397 domain-containing protein n=1 Tax=unclassified Streptomyces TaxID=2593676 RepID=UPI002FF0A2E0